MTAEAEREAAAGGGGRGMETAAGGRRGWWGRPGRGHRLSWEREAAAPKIPSGRSLLAMKSAMRKVVEGIYPLLDVVRSMRNQCFELDERIGDEINMALLATEDVLNNQVTKLMRIQTMSEAMACLEVELRKVLSSSTSASQDLLILFESVFDSIFNKLMWLQGIIGSTSVFDSSPSISVLFKETLEKLTRIKLQTRIELGNREDTAEGSQGGELISSEVGDEAARPPMEKEVALGEIEAAFEAGMAMEEKLETFIEKEVAWEEIEAAVEAGMAMIEKTEALEEIEAGMAMEEKLETFIEKAESLEESEAAVEAGMAMEEKLETFIEKAEALEESEAAVEAGMAMEEKLETNLFFGIGCTTFLSRLANLFSRPCEAKTSLSPMHFTHATPLPGDDAAASVASTLQIFSVKLQEINEEALGSNWPLRVYGTVAARDTVDRNLNVLFHRERHNCQTLTQKEPCLKLTGPSRAILAIDPVDFEIDLRLMGEKESEDIALMQKTFVYSGNNETNLLKNDCCRIMFQCAKLENTVQATVVSVRVINWSNRASWPFRHGGKIICVAKGPIGRPEDKDQEVVLQDQVAAPHNGYLHLSRRAVSVELNGQLIVTIHASKSSGHVFFPVQECKSSQGKCRVGPYEVEVTVAWSLLIRDKRCFISECVDDDGRLFECAVKKIRRRKTPLLESRSAREIYSLLDLISKNAMKLKTEPKLRISDYTITEVKILMAYIYSDATNLLRMMEAHYKDGTNAIFNFLDQLCEHLEHMGLIAYKRKSQSFSELRREEAKEMGGKEQDSNAPQTDEDCFLSYRQSWVYNWSISCGSFTEMTSLSPMHFTHSTPGHSPVGALVDSTLQIYSIQVTKIKEGSGLSWPLRVYGVVAARDTVDRNRNILFSRQRNNYQLLTQEDPFLLLIGPSRAIVTREPAYVEIELKAKGATESEEDSVLMIHSWYYSSSYEGLRALYTPLEGDHCTMVLSAEPVGDSVQATILGIHVHVPEGRPSPFEYGGRVVCSSLPRRKGKLPDSQDIAADPLFRQIVIQDGPMTACSKGYLSLSRRVVSVKLQGNIEIVIEAKSQCGAKAHHQVLVSIEARECGISEDLCQLGDCELKISVAWSRLVKDKASISML